MSFDEELVTLDLSRLELAVLSAAANEFLIERKTRGMGDNRAVLALERGLDKLDHALGDRDGHVASTQSE